MEIGIIGFGQFGQFAAKHMKNCKVFAADRSDKKNIADGVTFTSIKEAASKEIVILSVPINKFESVVNEIKDFLKPGALVLDVCSVKVKPARIMEKLMPKNVEIIATHPLFGAAVTRYLFIDSAPQHHSTYTFASNRGTMRSTLGASAIDCLLS